MAEKAFDARKLMEKAAKFMRQSLTEKQPDPAKNPAIMAGCAVLSPLSTTNPAKDRLDGRRWLGCF